MVYVGHLNCYQKSNEILEKLVSVKISASQIYRVTDTYGAQIGETTDPQERTLTPVKDDETLYVEADGGMILTRKDGNWSYELINVSGQKMSSGSLPFSSSNGKAHLQLPSVCKAGIYFIRINNNGSEAASTTILINK